MSQGDLPLRCHIRLLVAAPTAVVILVVSLPSILILVAALPLAPIRLIRPAFILLPLFLFVSPRSLLLLLVLLSTWLLSMLLDCRSPLLVLISHPGRFLSSPLSRCGSPLSWLLLIVLADNLVTGLVAVLLTAHIMLLLNLMGIPVPGILPLVDRPRRTRRNRAAVPLVPASALLLPAAAPVLSPPGRCICAPAAEIGGWLPVVAHRYPQHEQRHDGWLDITPGTVVP